MKKNLDYVFGWITGYAHGFWGGFCYVVGNRNIHSAIRIAMLSRFPTVRRLLRVEDFADDSVLSRTSRLSLHAAFLIYFLPILALQQIFAFLANLRNVGVRTTRGPSINSLIAAVDLFPAPRTRKLLKKLVADQGEHIGELTSTGRFKAARWIWLVTWALLLWYGARSLVSSVAKAVQGRAA